MTFSTSIESVTRFSVSPDSAAPLIMPRFFDLIPDNTVTIPKPLLKGLEWKIMANRKKSMVSTGWEASTTYIESASIVAG